MSVFLRIASRRAGFRRAGIAHPAEAIDHPIERFTADQVAALKAEPMLTVVELAIVDMPIPGPKSAPIADAKAISQPAGSDGAAGQTVGTAGAASAPTTSSTDAPGPTGSDGSSVAAGGEPSPPATPEERQAQIVAAIARLDPAGFTKAGTPKVPALEAVLGFQISAAERDAAWAIAKP